MWDNHALLRNIGNTLFALCGMAIVYGVISYTIHLPSLFPLQSVRLSVAPDKVVPSEVLQVVRSEVRGNIFTVDIDRLRRSLEKLPWVRIVNIRREFPDRLMMEVQEHQAIARWNSGALVNQQGEVFVANSEKSLPRFIGPDDASHEVAAHYAQWSKQLAVLDFQVTQLVLSPRHAWQVRLSNELVLELGREDMQQRLARFVTVYPYSLAAMNMKYVDLRYPNGFAVDGRIKS